MKDDELTDFVNGVRVREGDAEAERADDREPEQGVRQPDERAGARHCVEGRRYCTATLATETAPGADDSTTTSSSSTKTKVNYYTQKKE